MPVGMAQFEWGEYETQLLMALTAAADSRKVNLANGMNQKGCQIPGFSPIAPVSPVAST
jgi:hypothetical protein